MRYARFFSPLLIAASLLLTGCATPQPTLPTGVVYDRDRDEFSIEIHPEPEGQRSAYPEVRRFVTLSDGKPYDPERVIIHSDGRFELVSRARADGSAPTGELEFVPVFSEQADGALTPGVTYRGTSDGGYHYMKYPGGVVRQPDGAYEVEMYTWFVAHGPKGHLWEHKLRGSERAQVYDSASAP